MCRVCDWVWVRVAVLVMLKIWIGVSVVWMVEVHNVVRVHRVGEYSIYTVRSLPSPQLSL